MRVTLPLKFKSRGVYLCIGDMIGVWEHLWPGVISADFRLEPLKANVPEVPPHYKDILRAGMGQHGAIGPLAEEGDVRLRIA